MRRQLRANTAPEIAVRRALHAQGFRFRVAYPVPGLPRRTIDIAFTRARLAVFLDGCFWHACPQHGTLPRSNGQWWADKLQANQKRDRETNDHLVSLGWDVRRYWEHEDPKDVVEQIKGVLRAV